MFVIYLLSYLVLFDVIVINNVIVIIMNYMSFINHMNLNINHHYDYDYIIIHHHNFNNFNDY